MPRDGSGIDTTLTGIASRGLQEAARALARNVSAGNRERIAALMATQDPAQLRRLVTEILSATPARDATQADCLSLRLNLPGIGPSAVREQIVRFAAEILPRLKATL